jgi:hypothetical protein
MTGNGYVNQTLTLLLIWTVYPCRMR